MAIIKFYLLESLPEKWRNSNARNYSAKKQPCKFRKPKKWNERDHASTCVVITASLSVGTTADSKKIAWVFQIVLVVKRVISELTASVADIDLGKKCPYEVGCPHLRRSEPPSSA